MIDDSRLSRILSGYPEASIDPSSKLALLTDQAVVELIIKPYFDLAHDGKPKRLVDVGAAYGSVASIFFDSGWHVDAFEPDPTCRQILESRFTSNLATFKIWPFAVDSIDRDSCDFVQNRTPGLSGLDPSPHGGDEKRILIRTVRLDTFFKERGVDELAFLKIDTEGNDVDVLFSNNFACLRPNIIFIEYGLLFPRQTLELIETTVKKMNEQGYDCLVFEYNDFGNFSRGSWQHWLTRIHVNKPPSPDQKNAFGNILFYEKSNTLFEDFFLQKLSLLG